MVKELENMVINWKHSWQTTVNALILAVKCLDDITDILEDEHISNENKAVLIAETIEIYREGESE